MYLHSQNAQLSALQRLSESRSHHIHVRGRVFICSLAPHLADPDQGDPLDKPSDSFFPLSVGTFSRGKHQGLTNHEKKFFRWLLATLGEGPLPHLCNLFRHQCFVKTSRGIGIQKLTVFREALHRAFSSPNFRTRVKKWWRRTTGCGTW